MDRPEQYRKVFGIYMIGNVTNERCALGDIKEFGKFFESFWSESVGVDPVVDYH